MILLTFIKKEVKDFFRNKSDVIVMLIFPVILIFIMGKSLNNLMSVEKNIFDNKIIYYKINNSINNQKQINTFYNFMINFEKNTNVKFIESNNHQKSVDNVNNDEAICFIDIYNNNIKYFRNEKKESTESKIFRNLYEQYMKKDAFFRSINKYNKNQINNLLNYQMKISLKDENINKEEVNSYTYYTFAELILIILYISVLTSISMYKERFLHTMTRLKVSSTNKFSIFLSKISLGIIIGLIQIFVVYIVSTKVLNVNWGENLIYILIVLISLIIFSSVLGIFISIIFSDQKTAYTVNNIIIIIMGFLGGAYVPICLVKSVRITSFLCEIMPSYWANIAILGLNYNISTKYYLKSISICLGLSILMIILGSIISKRKVGGSFD